MKLRSQLLVMSLFLLSLPWAGYQYIVEMERVLLESNERELTASARALALMLADESHIFLGADEPSAAESIYFHSLELTPVVDGKPDDWYRFDFEAVEFRQLFSEAEVNSSGTLRAGMKDQNLYLYIEVKTDSPQFNQRLDNGVLVGDKLLLHTADGILEIAPFAEGQVFGRWRNSSQYADRASEYRVQGRWHKSSEDKESSYQIELQISPALIGNRLGVEFARANLQEGSVSELILGMRHGAPEHYVTASSELDEHLATFVNSGLRLGVSDRSGWLVGKAGELQHELEYRTEISGKFIDRAYGFLLDNSETRELDSWQQQGRFQTLDVLSALTGDSRAAVFSWGTLRVHRAAVPIIRGGEVLGAVIAEKSSASVVDATDTAFGRLAFWVMLATLIATLALMAYASVLSLRIRRLSRAAQESMIDPASGQLAQNFPQTKSGDEIGELGRSYGQLLSRLDEYTQYLKTLSGKLSHELRTPLAIIRSSLDNLDQEPSVENQAKTYSNRAKEGTERLSAILNAMSSASHLEESVRSYELEPLNLSELVEHACASYRAAYPDTQFRAVLSEERLQVNGSAELVMQLLDKLTDNARDFCAEDGEIEIGLSRSGKEIRLWVGNDGALLPENMQAQLFDSLVSVRQGMESSSPHLGLGLYIVRLIAEHHKAHVSAKNRQDESGVEFFVEFSALE